jgi:hypothetical protein
MRTLNLQLVGSTPLLLHHISRHQFREQIASVKGETMSIEDEASEVMVKIVMVIRQYLFLGSGTLSGLAVHGLQ